MRLLGNTIRTSLPSVLFTRTMTFSSLLASQILLETIVLSVFIDSVAPFCINGAFVWMFMRTDKAACIVRMFVSHSGHRMNHLRALFGIAPHPDSQVIKSSGTFPVNQNNVFKNMYIYIYKETNSSNLLMGAPLYILIVRWTI